MYSLGASIGGPTLADAFIKGKGLSLILRSVKIDFLKPVFFPDTV
jgi:acyl-CoA thioesterase FadM